MKFFFPLLCITGVMALVALWLGTKKERPNIEIDEHTYIRNGRERINEMENDFKQINGLQRHSRSRLLKKEKDVKEAKTTKPTVTTSSSTTTNTSPATASPTSPATVSTVGNTVVVSTKSPKSAKKKSKKDSETDDQTLAPTRAMTRAETALRTLAASHPHSRTLTQAINSGLIPQSMMEDIDTATPCGMVAGAMNVTSEPRVLPNSNLLSLTGVFTPSDGTPTSNIEASLFGVNGPQGTSALRSVDDAIHDEGLFEIVLTDPLPGIIPYFLVFTPSNCNEEEIEVRSRHLEIDDGYDGGMSIIYVQNDNKIYPGRSRQD